MTTPMTKWSATERVSRACTPARNPCRTLNLGAIRLQCPTPPSQTPTHLTGYIYGGKTGRHHPTPETSKQSEMVAEKSPPSTCQLRKNASNPGEIPRNYLHTQNPEQILTRNKAEKLLLDYLKTGSIKRVWYSENQHLIPWFLISEPEGEQPNG